jgi:hypothetical protein
VPRARARVQARSIVDGGAASGDPPRIRAVPPPSPVRACQRRPQSRDRRAGLAAFADPRRQVTVLSTHDHIGLSVAD